MQIVSFIDVSLWLKCSSKYIFIHTKETEHDIWQNFGYIMDQHIDDNVLKKDQLVEPLT